MLKSRLPKITAELDNVVDRAIGAGARRIAEGAKERVPVDTGKLRGAIHVDRRGQEQWAVVAGNTEVFYGHLVEHGGAFRGPRPFLVPATEAGKPEVVSLVSAALRGL